MKYILLVFLLLYSSLYGHSNHIKNTKLQKITLQLHWKHQFEFAGFIAAKEKGFYKDAGLDVELKEYEFGINIVDEVLSGRSEYGIYNSYTLIDYLKGKPIKLVASFFKRAALVLITSPDIHSPKDLVGKKIMASTKEDFILNFKPYFDGYGVSIDDLELVNHTYRLDEFIDGEVSAMTAFVSDQLYKLDKYEIEYNVLDPSNDNLYVLQEELFTSEEEAKNHPLRVSAFRDASIKGWQYALSHKEELIDIIYEKYSKGISKESLRSEARGVEKLILPYTYDIGSIDKNFLNKQIKLFKNYYGIGIDKDIDNFIYKDQSNYKDIKFTKDELEYIKNNKEINVCLQYDLFPIDGFEGGEFVGMMSDIYKLLSDSTSLKFNPIPSSSIEKQHENINTKKCELLSVYASQNYENIVPTKPFAKTHFTFISKLDRSFVSDPKLLKGKVLLTQLESFKNYLKSYYPYLTIEVEENKNKMIKRLLNDEVYAIITVDEQADYLIDKFGYGKLKINGFLSKENPLEISIGVQKDEPLLLSIMQKALDNIPQNRLQAIENSWRITRYHKSTDYSLVLKVLLVMSFLLVLMYYYQRKLKSFNRELEYQVYKKTKALREVNESLETTVKEKVEELIQKDEILTMQSKQAVMGEMISMIAHQWRQPLNTITLKISHIQIQSMIGNNIDNDQLLKILNDISETIVYLSETIDDFKTYFHPNKEASQIEIHDLLNKAVNFILPRLKTSSVLIDIQKFQDINVKVYVNELIQVLLNILNNAIDAYEDIQQDDKRIDISTKKENDKVLIYIKDRAGGIKKENINKLFEPYFSTKGKNGTGLGLYMSKMIIEKQFGGKIKVETSKNGSTFIVEIPLDVLSHR
jgi:signal transduction histidine kinase/ABC-type nitrate/sulfonate/bicarbonate transport system substrate-binding protein